MSPTSPLITTKFAPPRIASQAVPREHLLERLNGAQGSRLVLLTGGAGYGKTTLLAQWRQGLVREGASVAWLSLAPEDGTLAAFGAHLLGTLRQAGLPLGDELLALLADDREDGARAFASVLINTIARASGRLFLIVDDFHHAVAPRIATMLQLLIDRAPTNLHLVLASRTQPSLLLGRLRGMGDVCEIGCGELGFSHRESLAFLKSVLGDDLEADTAHAAHDLTVGWPLGLQMLANALKGHPDRKAISPSLPDPSGLGDYFAEEVLAPLPAPLIGFLRKIAILPRFNAAIAAHVTGSPDADDLLAELRTRNLFVLPDQEEPQWYRLHPLFGAFLTRSDALAVERPALHRRASQWFEEAGRITEAVHQAILSEDLDVLIGLLERSQGEYHSISHLKQYLDWLESVPMERLARHPSALLTGAWTCLLLVQTGKAETWLATLEASETGTTWTPHISLTKAVIALQRDDLARCFALLGALEGRQFTHQPYEQARSAMYLICLAYMGLHDKARQYFNAPRTSPLHASSDETALLFQSTGAYAAFLEGDIPEAGRLASEVLRRAERIHGPGSVSACNSAVVMATVFYESDRLDDARDAIGNRLGMLRFSTPSYMIGAALCYARLRCQQDGPQGALKYLARKIAGFRALGVPRGLANMLTEQVRILLGCGDWRQAEGPQKTLDGLAQEHRNQQTPTDAEIVVLATLSRARLSLARQEPELALRLVDSVQAIADRYLRGQWQAQVAMLRALALDALGRRDEAMRLLRELLDLACRKGLIRTLLDEGKPLRELLLHLDCQDDAVLESFRLRLANAPLQASPGAAPSAQSPGMTDSGLLTRREQEIIGLLEQSMSNKRIAQALNLSLETVKWNLKNIYAKLGVAGRYEAIIAARQQMEDH
ncbi:LuxR C-terminal-related transcriptional regulator [Zestomonas carbonaria]|uniref:HTH-type transcriptional regulator MalT n=1 Tax=Zestomonas carbonaria TaxID=2762745 RepID=A0A7U7EJU6_9GAMM|nr:LuxR C-terminal-related transcriptional regulator [Pseudomonas carbonaria]CAD5106186.1 HTH-type transcriptional regulator MalT [Pseudomonas carbonaria]